MNTPMPPHRKISIFEKQINYQVLVRTFEENSGYALALPQKNKKEPTSAHTLVVALLYVGVTFLIETYIPPKKHLLGGSVACAHCLKQISLETTGPFVRSSFRRQADIISELLRAKAYIEVSQGGALTKSLSKAGGGRFWDENNSQANSTYDFL